VPDVGGLQNGWNVFFAAGYGPMAQLAHQTAAMPGVGLIGVNMGWNFSANPDGFHYSWDFHQTQRAAKTITDMGLPAPDIYMLQLYHANSSDIASALQGLTGAPDPNGIAIPADRIFAVEFATSSSLAPTPYGNQVASSGDANTPTTDLPGHSQWLNNALCAYQRAGLSKLGYFFLYDAYDFWSAPPFSQTGLALAWNGYWGLFPLPENQPAKPAWSVLSSFYLVGSPVLACADPPLPILTLTANPAQVRAGQPFTLWWTAADVRSLSIDSGVGPVSGSLGSVTVTAPATPGNYNYTLTGTNTNGANTQTRTAIATVTTF
jgi:hypothetical protein